MERSKWRRWREKGGESFEKVKQIRREPGRKFRENQRRMVERSRERMWRAS